MFHLASFTVFGATFSGCCMIRDIICLSGDKVNLEQETDELKDYRFTKWMSKNVKLQGIPPSAFYSEPHKSLVETSVRYCFINVWKKLCHIHNQLVFMFEMTVKLVKWFQYFEDHNPNTELVRTCCYGGDGNLI